jgi:proteasome assembly chaperone (PAC2) family protein
MIFNTEYKYEIPKGDLKNPIMMIGWPGIALVGKIAITTIIESLNAKEYIEIEYYDFPPKSIIEKGTMNLPTAKIYHKSGEEYDFFLLTADFQPQTSEGIYDFSKNICELMKDITNNNMQMYISTGALVPEALPETVKVHVSGTNPNIVEKFLKLENTKLMEGGFIAGANGILPTYAGNKGYAPGVCLLAETIPVPMLNADPKASKALVKILKEYFSLSDVTFEELDKQIKDLNKVISSIKSQVVKGFRKEKPIDESYFR